MCCSKAMISIKIRFLKNDKTTAFIHRYFLKMQRTILATAAMHIPCSSTAKPALILFKESKSNLLQKILVTTSDKLYQVENPCFT